MRREEELKCLLQRPPPTAAGDDGSESLSNGRTPPTPHATHLHQQQHQQTHHLRHHNNHRAHSPSPRIFLPPTAAGGPPPLVPPGDSPPVSAPIGSSGGVGVVDSSDSFPSSVKEHPPKSPVRLSGSARVHLGDHGHTVVQTKKGITAREALARPMKLRKLAPETCAFYRVSDPQKVGIYEKLCRILSPLCNCAML